MYCNQIIHFVLCHLVFGTGVSATDWRALSLLTLTRLVTTVKLDLSFDIFDMIFATNVLLSVTNWPLVNDQTLQGKKGRHGLCHTHCPYIVGFGFNRTCPCLSSSPGSWQASNEKNAPPVGELQWATGARVSFENAPWRKVKNAAPVGGGLRWQGQGCHATSQLAQADKGRLWRKVILKCTLEKGQTMQGEAVTRAAMSCRLSISSTWQGEAGHPVTGGARS